MKRLYIIWINLEDSLEKERCRIKKEGDRYTVEKGYERHPVIFITWYGADAYAKDTGKRLPTEEEWERAARGLYGKRYPWGNQFNAEICNTYESGFSGTTEVDRFPKGKGYYGCYDMAGNVGEWTDSWYDKGEKFKAVRGGSWFDSQGYARCAYRFRLNPYHCTAAIGFRCVRTPVK
jgi:formylglycine-generating enzyme required for sulfatase activity